jgi:pimeloyl-ACP methyl ester carboxylesterase
MNSPDVSEFEPSLLDEDIAELRERIRRTRWPRESDPGWTRGVPAEYLRELSHYWAEQFDWGDLAGRLAVWPQFRTRIDGQTVHFAHVVSSSPHAVPLVLTHGWPGSFLEFLRVTGPLAEPARHGGDAADAFHLVIPSLPGYGYSTPLEAGGWGLERIGAAFASLMGRLGYDRYVAQGGDWGALVTRMIALADPAHVAGVHVNSAFTIPPRDLDLDALDAIDRERVKAMRVYDREWSGYRHLQATRPRTLAYALTDSPVGQLAWIVEKFFEWTDSATRPEDAVDRDHMLSIVSLYWLTGTAGSSADLYYETAHTRWPAEKPDAPMGVSIFRHDKPLPVRALARASANIVSWRDHERGGHFAAMEQPEALVADIRDFVRPLRSSGALS